MKQKLKVSAVFLAALLFMTCENLTRVMADIAASTPGEIPPFVISKPVVEINGRTNNFSFAGISFRFLNNGQEQIDSITVRFMLFDSRSQGSPFIGGNRFEITKLDSVAPGENKEILISLDNVIYNAPTEPYLIDFFYVAEIHYTDESRWEDKPGKYRVRF